MNLLWFLIVGIIAGWLTGKIMKGGGYGLLGDLVLGIVGGIIGGHLFGFLIPVGGLVGAILVALLGAILLVAVVRLIKKA